jgi:hypothetical protein
MRPLAPRPAPAVHPAQAPRPTQALRSARTLAPKLLLGLTLALASCAFPAPHPPEYLDSETAALVTTVSSPIVFARAHLDVAANARQYATVAAVSVNRSGHYEYVLLVYLWSTVDARLGIDRHPGQNVILLADDRAIRLVRDGRSMHEVGISTPLHAPEHIRGQPRIYRTDRETLQFLSGARRVRLLLEGDEDPRPFDVWTDGRRALAQFASATK